MGSPEHSKLDVYLMKITFFGSGPIGIPSLEALKESPNELCGIFTQPARPAGRKRTPTPTPVANWARQNGIRCTEATNINAPDMREELIACGGQLLVVIAFGQKISQDVVALHRAGAINVHASLLPKYRGAAPINWAIINGETQTGISIITLADKMDAGEILSQAKIPIGPDDTAETLHDKLALIAPKVLLETIEAIETGKAVYTSQDESQVTFAHKLTKSDGFIDFSAPAEEIRNRIRGLWPWPGAQTIFVSAKAGKTCRVTIAKARVIGAATGSKDRIGLLDENLNVICGAGSLKIGRLKPAGGSLMDFKAFVNGRDVRPHDRFVRIDESTC
ncbi:MAG: methionyl-tRNA formyltransferase [Planctomycetota bacterium]|mgnify:CR=1 FL=1|nr:MAG: methionyl-tRNA formyltransferase [Planctomycetota bacterium]